MADGRVLPHGEGQGRGIECYVLSFPGSAGSRLGCVPAPEVVEGLDLPVIPAADSVIPPVSGALGPTSSEAAAGGDTPKDKSEGAGLTAGPPSGPPEPFFSFRHTVVGHLCSELERCEPPEAHSGGVRSCLDRCIWCLRVWYLCASKPGLVPVQVA